MITQIIKDVTSVVVSKVNERYTQTGELVYYTQSIRIIDADGKHLDIELSSVNKPMKVDIEV